MISSSPVLMVSDTIIHQEASGPMPSITSVTSFYNRKVFAQWRKRVGEEEANKVTTVATRRGTNFHEVCEQYLMNVPLSEIDMLPTTKALFLTAKGQN